MNGHISDDIRILLHVPNTKVMSSWYQKAIRYEAICEKYLAGSMSMAHNICNEDVGK